MSDDKKYLARVALSDDPQPLTGADMIQLGAWMLRHNLTIVDDMRMPFVGVTLKGHSFRINDGVTPMFASVNKAIFDDFEQTVEVLPNNDTA